MAQTKAEEKHQSEGPKSQKKKFRLATNSNS